MFINCILLIPLFLTCIFSVNQSSICDTSQGYTAIQPCSREETIHFLDILDERGALIGTSIQQNRMIDNTIIIKGLLEDDNIVELSQDGKLNIKMVDNSIPYNEGELFLYKGYFHNDGNTCYLLQRKNVGDYHEDYIWNIWKLIDNRLEILDLYENIADSLMPGEDAHLFYDNHANPFLIEKDGIVYFRWLNGYVTDSNTELYTYYWKGNKLNYASWLSNGKSPIIADTKRLAYFSALEQLQRQSLTKDSMVYPSVKYEELVEFAELQKSPSNKNIYPQIYMSQNGNIAIKKFDKHAWQKCILQKDCSLMEGLNQYLLFKGNFFTKEHEAFILVQTSNVLMFHNFKDKIWAWEVHKDSLKPITLDYPTHWIAKPFILHFNGEYLFRFIEKQPYEPELSYLITCKFIKNKSTKYKLSYLSTSNSN